MRRRLSHAFCLLALASWLGSVQAGELPDSLPGPKGPEAAPTAKVPNESTDVLPGVGDAEPPIQESGSKPAEAAPQEPKTKAAQTVPAVPQELNTKTPDSSGPEAQVPSTNIAAQGQEIPKTAELIQPPRALQEGSENGFAPSSEGGGRFVAGLGMYVVAPIFESNRAFSFTSIDDKGNSRTTTTDFDYHLNAAPRLWLGYVCEGGWGFRFSWWYFDQKSSVIGVMPDSVNDGSILASASPAGLPGISVTAPSFVAANLGPGSADILLANTRLKLNVFDVEATKAFSVCNSTLLVTAGVRAARLDETYGAFLFNNFNDPTTFSEIQAIHSGQRFIGAGPTMSFQGHCPLGSTAFGMYGIARGAILVGDYHNGASQSGKIVEGGDAFEAPTVAASTPRDTVVPVGELELGVDWNGEWGRIRPLFRIGLVAESFLNAFSNNTNSSITPNTINGSLTFIGFTLCAGITY